MLTGAYRRLDWNRGSFGFYTEMENTVLYTLAIVLLILWVLGFVTSYTMGGLIHVLLVVAVVMILVQFIQGRRA